ncbi:capsular polysaccharide biosynthesis protein [Bifidobacterium sp. DSM 109959]|uniref:Capsular polysaccharide biosynthesis protein n=1 Tax=Bifidobacterium olomucense TaxID=2675324 RepID=A0A7Y0EWF3_9BIFI|nr:capsular polysaccharide biosynthesis protein [Bifidobacterium sp. DSM 109959]
MVFVTRANVKVIGDLLPKGATVAYVRADSMLSRFLGTLLMKGEHPEWWMRLMRKTLHLLSGKRNRLAFEYAGRHLTGIPAGPFDAVLDFEGYDNINTIIGGHISAPVHATWVHNEDVDLKDTYRCLARCYDRIFCVSNTVLDAFTRRYPHLAERARVLRNPVDANKVRRKAMLAVTPPPTRTSAAALRIVTVCRLVREKNLALSVRIAAALRERGLSFLWEVYGEGVSRDELQILIDGLGLNERFILRGEVRNPYPYMKQADVYVQTSRCEGFGLTVQEAKILGVPAVVTDIPAFREQIVDGQTGFIRAADAESFADVIIRLADHPEERQRITENLAALDWTDAQNESPLFELLGLR